VFEQLFSAFGAGVIPTQRHVQTAGFIPKTVGYWVLALNVLICKVLTATKKGSGNIQIESQQDNQFCVAKAFLRLFHFTSSVS